MVANNRCATQSELLSVLQEPETQSHSCTWIEHLESCPECVERLTALAAHQTLWTESREQLIHKSPDMETSESSTPSSRIEGTLAHYRIEGTIGYGGMATVYRGFDPPLHRPVAIKILHEHLSRFGSSRQRFLREAQAAAAIAHPNVIPIYGVHHEAGKSFLVMPLIQGGSLQQRIEREGPFPLEDMLRIALQVCEGLNAAHTQGVVHRDVKPANILLEDGNKRVILSDFGLARTLDDATLSASGVISGTPAYMSPEQARGEIVDFRTDLFSLGSVMFAMCTGHSPFHANSTLKLLRDVSELTFPSVRLYQEQLPPWVDELIRCFAAKATQDRIASTSQGAELIRHCLQHVSNPNHPLPEQVVSGLQRKTKQIPRISIATWQWGLAVFCIVLVANLAIAWPWPQERTDQKHSRPNKSASEKQSAYRQSPGPLQDSDQFESSSLTSLPETPSDSATNWAIATELQKDIDKLRIDIDVLTQSMGIAISQDFQTNFSDQSKQFKKGIESVSTQ